MNSKSASAQRGGSTSFSNMEFDFGISSNRSRSLNDLKNQNNSTTFASNSSSSYTLQSMNLRPAAPPTHMPSWTHQSAPSKSNHSATSNPPISMAGDIFGKTWAAASSSSPSPGNIGIVNKNPNLFGDLVSSALGRCKGDGRCNVPLKNTVSVPSSTSTRSSSSRADSLSKGGNSVKTNSNLRNPNPGGSFHHDFGGKQHGSFGSLMNFEPKQSPLHSDDIFGDCEKIAAAGIMDERKSKNFVDYDPFSENCKQSGGDVVEEAMLESCLSSSVIAGLEEWESDSKYEGATTEINGVSPAPVGVSASNAFGKGMNHQKRGQYADAIKWLSWALVLPRKSSEEEMINEVLSCRASCYKEVGEYKKAIADCTEVLKKEGGNVGVLVKRALLYESVEKYRLGAEDLRKVMKLDPTNRVARSTIHRLTQLS